MLSIYRRSLLHPLLLSWLTSINYNGIYNGIYNGSITVGITTRLVAMFGSSLNGAATRLFPSLLSPPTPAASQNLIISNGVLGSVLSGVLVRVGAAVGCSAGGAAVALFLWRRCFGALFSRWDRAAVTGRWKRAVRQRIYYLLYYYY